MRFAGPGGSTGQVGRLDVQAAESSVRRMDVGALVKV